MKKRILSCLMALALCLTLLPTAALAEETEGTAQTSPAVEESTDPANGEAKQESQPAETKQENQSAAPEQENQPAEAKREGQSAEQEEQQEDSAAKQAVANVQAMIDDLPDAAELDGMDDEDAMAVYEAFQTACDAYYETLTEGQQAQLKNTEKLEALSAWFSQSAALAAGGHQHPICGASCTDDENHDNVTWRGASNVTGLKAGGHYYLIRDVKVSETWHPEDGVVLCLNGYSITATEKGINVIEVDKGKTFTLTDCGTAGTVTHEAEKRGRGVMVFGTFNLYGGNITGNQTDGNYNDRGTFGAGVYVATYSVFNMYGGKITDNMGFIAVALAGTARELAGRVHPKFGEFFVAAVYLAIGPCLAIPRTSSTAFEMLVPLLPEGVSLGTARLVFAIGFFVVAFVLTLRPGVITRVLGRITGPALIALIVLVVGAAVISPLGPAAAPQAPYDAGAAVQGFLTGYQTMDLLASLAFGIIIAETIHELGVTDDKRVAFEISRSGVIAGALMAVIYCGLALAGMQLSTVMPDATNGAAILARSASMHFGLAGTVVVFAIFFLACMNVCIGLISCCSRYFCETYVVEGGAEASEEAMRRPFAVLAFVFAAFSCVLSNVGLDVILMFSVPMLNALYPVAIVLVLMGLVHGFCDAHPQVWIWVGGVVAVQSVITSVRDAFFAGVWLPFDALPLADIGAAWAPVAVVAFVIGLAHSQFVAHSRS